MCSTRYTNNITETSPACVQTCQYKPVYENIDFNHKDINGVYINDVFKDIIGKYVHLSVDLTEKERIIYNDYSDKIDVL
jgi:hypothetical protein